MSDDKKLGEAYGRNIDWKAVNASPPPLVDAVHLRFEVDLRPGERREVRFERATRTRARRDGGRVVYDAPEDVPAATVAPFKPDAIGPGPGDPRRAWSVESQVAFTSVKFGAAEDLAAGPALAYFVQRGGPFSTAARASDVVLVVENRSDERVRLVGRVSGATPSAGAR